MFGSIKRANPRTSRRDKVKTRQPTEHEIQKQILDWLKLKNIFHWRNNSGAMMSSYKGKSRFMRFGAVGSPDIFVLLKGTLYGIEVKGPKGKPTLEQLDFGNHMMLSGGKWFVVHSLDDFLAVLEGVNR